MTNRAHIHKQSLVLIAKQENLILSVLQGKTSLGCKPLALCSHQVSRPLSRSSWNYISTSKTETFLVQFELHS